MQQFKLKKKKRASLLAYLKMNLNLPAASSYDAEYNDATVC